MITGPTQTEEILTPISSIFGAFTILNCCGQVESSGFFAAGLIPHVGGDGLTVCCLTMCQCPPLYRLQTSDSCRIKVRKHCQSPEMHCHELRGTHGCSKWQELTILRHGLWSCGLLFLWLVRKTLHQERTMWKGWLGNGDSETRHGSKSSWWEITGRSPSEARKIAQCTHV